MDIRAPAHALDTAVYQYSTLTAADQLHHITNVISSGVLGSIVGHTVRDFENQAAAYLGRRGAVATSSATAALELLLRCLPHHTPKDRVVVPEVCWISVPTAVTRTGRTPIIVPATDDLTPHWEQIAPLLDEHTTAVILAHLRGRPAPDTPRIAAELAHRGITLIEDCAQGWGATLDGRPVGHHGLAAVFSTETHKLVATGEGGVIVADDAQLLDRLRAVGGNTRLALPDSSLGRGNDRMSEIAAAAALPQLAHLEKLSDTLRALQAKLISTVEPLPAVAGVFPIPDEDAPPGLRARASNGSLVGLWMHTRSQANRIADRLFRAGIRHWWPGPGDAHLAENWPNAAQHAFRLVDIACYLDIQVPVLAEDQHPAFLNLVESVLRLDDESENA